MARKPTNRPTDSELAILTILWTGGPATVREIHETLGDGATVGYTTVLKLLQIMTEKGLVERDARQRAHVYRAVDSAEQTQSSLVQDLVNRAFGGSMSKLVQRALSAQPASQSEIEEIQRLLEEMGDNDSSGGNQ